MTKPKNTMEIFRLLDKSNCRQCGEKTCLAFAGAVFTGRRELADCPTLPSETLDCCNDENQVENLAEQNRDAYLAELKDEVAAIDLAESAARSGGEFDNGVLTLKVLGKNFSVDENGKLRADIHINPWVAVPFLSYILRGRGRTPAGNWVSFRDLKEGRERYPLFQKRCEEPMKQVADVYPGLFDDLVHIFSGRQVAEPFEADISVVLLPLPRVPLMICYWLPEDGLASSLNLYFDQTADENLDIGSLFSLGAGLAQMFANLARRHGFAEKNRDA
ncbi:MAG: DUF3786 domain-containing protein [Desulfobacterales bacterium]